MFQDLRYFKSKKTERGPLPEEWQKTVTPIMCSYKVVEASFEVWGMQTKSEDVIQKVNTRDFQLRIFYLSESNIHCFYSPSRFEKFWFWVTDKLLLGLMNGLPCPYPMCEFMNVKCKEKPIPKWHVPVKLKKRNQKKVKSHPREIPHQVLKLHHRLLPNLRSPIKLPSRGSLGNK